MIKIPNIKKKLFSKNKKKIKILLLYHTDIIKNKLIKFIIILFLHGNIIFFGICIIKIIELLYNRRSNFPVWERGANRVSLNFKFFLFLLNNFFMFLNHFNVLI